MENRHFCVSKKSWIRVFSYWPPSTNGKENAVLCVNGRSAPAEI